MAREYARIGTDMPDEASVRACTVEELFLYDHALYLRREMSRCGVVPMRPAVWAELATNATETKCRKWLKGLEKRRMVVVDEKYSEVLVRTYVRHDGLLGQPNVVAAMVSDYRLIASPKVRTAFLQEMRRLWDLELPPGERGGWLLAMGHYPRVGDKTEGQWPDVMPAASVARLRKAVGAGLYRDMSEACAEGHVPAFTEASPAGIPKPFTGPPGAGAIAVSAVPGSERRAPSAAARTPSGPADGEAADRAAAATHAQQLLDQTIGRPVPARTAKGLHDIATAALLAGDPLATVQLAATEWATRPGAGPGLLRNLLDDARSGTLTAPSSGPASRAAQTLELARQLDALQPAHGAAR